MVAPLSPAITLDEMIPFYHLYEAASWCGLLQSVPGPERGMTSPSQSLLLSDLMQLLEGEENTDVVLLAKGGQKIPAHSLILAAR